MVSSKNCCLGLSQKGAGYLKIFSSVKNFVRIHLVCGLAMIFDLELVKMGVKMVSFLT